MFNLSILIPIYNEKKKLNYLFKQIEKYSLKKKFKIEFILVDDGSTDSSCKKMMEFKKYYNYLNRNSNKRIVILKNKKNYGKGFSIKKGSKYCNNNFILTCDADLSTSFDQLDNWLQNNYIDINNHNTAYFGCRTHKNSLVKKKKIRSIIGFVYNAINYILFQTGGQDTQCGFKLYPKKLKKILQSITTFGYAHDIEIFKKIKINGSVIFLPVKWKHKNDSKVHIIRESFKMFFDTLKIRFC